MTKNTENYAEYFELLQKPIDHPTKVDVNFMKWFAQVWGDAPETLTWILECTNRFEIEDIGEIYYIVNYFNTATFDWCMAESIVILSLYHKYDDLHDEPLYTYCFDKDKLRARREKLIVERGF